jgi:2-oxoglutarate ferredoxin oxidoreductase subunit delta
MTIKILEDYCKGCGYCIEICPVEVFKESKRLNKMGYPLPEINNSSSCTYCKRCELICPEIAISVEKEENEHESTNNG